ncbi:MAG: cryptochrome/photolyase family protein [Gammaproteobacteria bacterium]
MTNIGILFPDQLSNNNPVINALTEMDYLIIYEPLPTFYEIPHHIQKIGFMISATRHFAESLNIPCKIVHIKISKKPISIDAALENLINNASKFQLHAIEPSDYRLKSELSLLSIKLGIGMKMYADPKFIATLAEFKTWAKDKKNLVQEFYYRWLRKKTNVLIDAQGNPEANTWNFDKENRQGINKLKEKAANPLQFKSDNLTIDCLYECTEIFTKALGKIDEFNWGVTHSDALRALDHFIKHNLKNYGEFQDAIDQENPFLFHSLLSPYINVGLLDPMAAIKAAESAYYSKQAPLNSVEGFIRQILGWREFIRGIYWEHMPDYKNLNYFQNKRNLPKFYWDGKTKMKCMATAISSTIKYSYSHHIQRLMVTGNFALLAGINPKEVHEWYLGVYIDALEWVELPNTLGMSLFADGGIVGSKPYCASGQYIKRMSNCCKDCYYKVDETVGETACPFNYLYWDFLERNRLLFNKNPRMKLALNNLEKKSQSFMQNVQNQSKIFIEEIN